MDSSFGANYTTLRYVLDVCVVAYLLYRGLLLIKGTRAETMLWGLLVLVVLFLASRWLGLVTLDWLLSSFLSQIFLVFVILFQDDIRRGLTKVGQQPLFKRQGKTIYDKTIEDVTLVCSKLGRAKLGAIIVLQREVGLDEFVEDAVFLDGVLNRKLLFSIFLKESPLHDGAVLIEGDRIKAAGCVLPLSFKSDIDPNLGTRHRAALGLSERSDAVVIVVSEETGSISLAREGRLIRNLDSSMLRDSLHRFLSTDTSLHHEREVA